MAPMVQYMPGETDSWKKPEVENILRDSLLNEAGGFKPPASHQRCPMIIIPIVRDEIE